MTSQIHGPVVSACSLLTLRSRETANALLLACTRRRCHFWADAGPPAPASIGSEERYDRRRRQDALGCMTPIEFEALTQAAHAA